MNSNKNRIISIFMCVVLALSASVFSAQAVDGAEFTPTRISVTVNGDTASSKGFCWYTKAATDTKIAVLDGDNDVTDSLKLSAVSSKWEGTFMHKVTVSGLAAGKEYSFMVGNGTVWSDKGRFTTDNGDDKVNFIAIADVQASSEENFQKGANTLSAAFKMMPDADFYANCGDFTNDSTNEEWDYYSDKFTALNIGTTMVPVAGNHDGLGVWHWFENMFNLDTSESVQTLNGVNYSYDYGNTHFAVLNTNDLLSISNAQLKWLQNDMNSTDKDWKIVFMHKTPYTLGKDGKWPDALYLQESAARIFDKCNVDLVMSGHDHMYLRTKPMISDRVNDEGTTYVLSGTAGSKRYEIRSFCEGTFIDKDQIAALTVQKHGYGNYWDGKSWDNTLETNVGGCFNCVSIDGGNLTLKSYILADEKDANGNNVVTNIDTMTLTKQTGQNKITFTGDNTTGKAEYYIGALPTITCLAGYTFLCWLPKFIFMLPKLISAYIKDGTF